MTVPAAEWLQSGEPPSQMDLSDIAVEMDVLWTRSIRDIEEGRVVEWGATIILGMDGRLRLVHIVEGDARSVVPRFKVKEGEEFVGTFHTHPYEDGTVGMAFSGIDIACTINDSERLSIVQSGGDLFALVRTERTPNRVERCRLEEEMDEAYRGYVRMGLADQEALLAANLDACVKYGLAFYWGKAFQNLQMVYRS